MFRALALVRAKDTKILIFIDKSFRSDEGLALETKIGFINLVFFWKKKKNKNNPDASKPVARHFNVPNSHHNMTICVLSLHQGNAESRKNLEQKFIFQLGTLSPHGINERLSFH